MKFWIKSIVSNNKVALTNAGYLSILQMLSLLFPLVTYPYLIKVIGSELYGKVLFLQGISYFLSAFVSYGFNLSSTRNISLNKGDLSKVSEIFTSTIICKSIIFLPTVLIYFSYGIFTQDSDVRFLFFICIGPLFYELLFPVWLYQGMEKMKYITIVNVVSKFIFLVSIFLLIKNKDDIELFAILNLLFYIVSGILSQYVALKYLAVNFTHISWNVCSKSFVDGFSVFLSSIFIALKDRLNVVAVGIMFGPHEVVIYDFAMKLISVISIPQNIIFTAFYPSVIKEKSISKIFKIGTAITFMNISLVIAAFIILPFIYKYMLGDLSNDIYNLYILLSTVIIVGISGVIGRFIMLAFGYDKALAKSTLINCLIYFVSIVLYISYCSDKKLVEFSILILFIYLSELVIRIFSLKFAESRNEKINKKTN
ncbi:oligosaccharide flippase family protein [Shewanella sp. A32]|uniref:oligosaccharide flippase family protein n=1 Tax=Shewanella sp. A32 TaxID=3031327 RepID=UPI0023B9A3B0|nr:oligosaccharide flippase family protein [Shewanella sp. A32]MDF0533015.1 oligosaccharide flippase family protein [Shewanella sp. A32]